MFLALETATDVCSVGYKNGNGEAFEKRSETKSTHSENLFLFIKELMKEHSFKIADLNAVLVSEGPGSYTGLRIAASGVKGLLFGADVPFFGVNTLASFATSAVNSRYPAPGTGFRIHSIVDARRKHLYYQQFVFDKQLKSQIATQVIPIVKFEERVKENEIIIGSGLNRVNEKIKDKAIILGKRYITAKSLIEIYQSENTDFISEVKPEKFVPKYYSSNQAN